MFMTTIFKVFFSKTDWPIKGKLMWRLLGKGERKYDINGPGHMTKMAATPICGKNL